MGAGTTRRVVVGALLLVAAALEGIGWAAPAPTTGAVASAVAMSPAITAGVTGRSEAVVAGWSDHRSSKARARLGVAVLGGLSVLLAAAVVTLTRPSPPRCLTLRRRWSLALRAPPPLLIA